MVRKESTKHRAAINEILACPLMTMFMTYRAGKRVSWWGRERRNEWQVASYMNLWLISKFKASFATKRNQSCNNMVVQTCVKSANATPGPTNNFSWSRYGPNISRGVWIHSPGVLLLRREQIRPLQLALVYPSGRSLLTQPLWRVTLECLVVARFYAKTLLGRYLCPPTTRF